MEKLGYFGECLVLQATSMGLGTCWVAALSQNSYKTSLKENEQVVCTIAIGYVSKVFTYKNGSMSASVDDIFDKSYAFDLGMAKLHFELGVGSDKWVFGNGGAYISDCLSKSNRND